MAFFGPAPGGLLQASSRQQYIGNIESGPHVFSPSISKHKRTLRCPRGVQPVLELASIRKLIQPAVEVGKTNATSTGLIRQATSGALSRQCSWPASRDAAMTRGTQPQLHRPPNLRTSNHARAAGHCTAQPLLFPVSHLSHPVATSSPRLFPLVYSQQ